MPTVNSENIICGICVRYRTPYVVPDTSCVASELVLYLLAPFRFGWERNDCLVDMIDLFTGF